MADTTGMADPADTMTADDGQADRGRNDPDRRNNPDDCRSLSRAGSRPSSHAGRRALISGVMVIVAVGALVATLVISNHMQQDSRRVDAARTACSQSVTALTKARTSLSRRIAQARKDGLGGGADGAGCRRSRDSLRFRTTALRLANLPGEGEETGIVRGAFRFVGSADFRAHHGTKEEQDHDRLTRTTGKAAEEGDRGAHEEPGREETVRCGFGRSGRKRQCRVRAGRRYHRFRLWFGLGFRFNQFWQRRIERRFGEQFPRRHRSRFARPQGQDLPV